MTPSLVRSVPRVAGIALASMAILGLGTFYWGFVEAQALSARPDNPRRIAFDRRIRRGAILDRWGTVLAKTSFGDGLPARSYPIPWAAPVTGYQTWRYGAGLGGASYGSGGAEAAYDAALRGDLGLSPRELLATRLLHRPQTGRDVRLTLDAALQAAAAEALSPREGAVVVIDVDTGAIRALVSLPTFDPAALDAGTYPTDDPEKRMFNRATQGRYPPGSTWKTVTLAGALQAGLVDLDTMVDDGAAIETFDGYQVACGNNPAGVTRFDIAHAYAWSCNVTFARLATALGPEEFRRLARAFGVDEAPPFPLAVTPGVVSVDPGLPPPELAAAGFGQGELLATPLHMALVAAAMARGGVVPVPHLLAEVQGLPGAAAREAHGNWRGGGGAAVAPFVDRGFAVAAVTTALPLVLERPLSEPPRIPLGLRVR
ncbi:MAG: penicillin-binding transpeptidase domain-containing protein, partial [Anaerolineae bacterium]